MQTEIKGLLKLAAACELNWNEAECVDWNEAEALSLACADAKLIAIGNANLLMALEKVEAESEGKEWESGDVGNWPMLILNSIGVLRTFQAEVIFSYLSDDGDRGSETYQLWIRSTTLEGAQDLACQWTAGDIANEHECFAIAPLAATEVACRYSGETEEVSVSELSEVEEPLWTLGMSCEAYVNVNNASIAEASWDSYRANTAKEIAEFIAKNLTLSSFSVAEIGDGDENLFLVWGGVTVRISLEFNYSEDLDSDSEEKLKAEMLKKIFSALVEKDCKVAESPASEKASEDVKLKQDVSYTVQLNDVYGETGPLSVTVDAAPWGLFVKAEGYGNATMMPGGSHVLCIESRGGELRVLAWQDMHSDEPTEDLFFDGALESRRDQDILGDFNGYEAADVIRDSKGPLASDTESTSAGVYNAEA